MRKTLLPPNPLSEVTLSDILFPFPLGYSTTGTKRRRRKLPRTEIAPNHAISAQSNSAQLGRYKKWFLEMSEIHEIVKRQFDKQAQNFSNWSVTKNIEYQKAYFDFCEISSQDTLLDFACGTGEYAIFAAPKVKYVHGVDISKGMIEIAQKQANKENLNNISFLCHPVEQTPFKDESFSIVICRSAFHHFEEYDKIFDVMTRCCQNGGRISIQDIVAYSDERIDSFFEEFERAVDVSHHKTLTKEYIKSLYDQRNIKIKNTFEIELELHVQEYLGHAQQSAESKRKISKLLEIGLNDPDLSKYFIIKGRDLFFKREVFLILGEK